MSSLPHVQIHLSEELLAEVRRYGMLRYPSEACGILLPTPLHSYAESQVIELPNRSMNARKEYIMDPNDIVLTLKNWVKTASTEEKNAIAVWHTHPGGGIGPSAEDMKKRIPGATYLVVAIDIATGKATPTWF